MGENTFDIKYYEQQGSLMDELYQLWFDNLAERIEIIIELDGINYKVKRRKHKRHKSFYPERYYNRIL